MTSVTLEALIARQRPGYSLEQAFYISSELYEAEREGWLAKRWYILAHASEVAEPKARIVRELLGESLILVRDHAGVLRGFYNVCPHRGSRLCDEDWHGALISCPYHAWSFRLDGALQAAPAMPDGFDPSAFGLRSTPVREVGGLILASLEGDAAEADALELLAAPLLAHHGVAQARIAARRSYPTAANWKLVFENFVECYHCFPTHPEYCDAMQHVHVIARDSGLEAARAWDEEVARWAREEADPLSPIDAVQRDRVSTFTVQGVSRGPIGGGRQVLSQDGRPVAPLMGRVSRYDGGVSGFRAEPFVFFTASADHAVIFQFLPTGPKSTEVVLTWLVDGEAGEADVDVSRMIWLWDVTTAQDKVIIERNAKGVSSRAYRPGPYSKLETMTARFVKYYLEQLGAVLSPPQ